MTQPVTLVLCDSSHPHPAETIDAQPVTAEWVKRPSLPEDEDGLVYLWCESYTRSQEGIDRGAHMPHGRGDATKSEPGVRAAKREMWAEQAPLVEVLLRSADVEVICDPERTHASEAGPAVIWGFACTSGDVVHYVCVKRNAVKAGLGPDIVRDLLGSRLTRPCWFTHELVEMRLDKSGVAVPRNWGWDSLWLPRRLAGIRQVASAEGCVRWGRKVA